MAGRHKIIIDQAEFEKLCSMQCTETEIAGWFSCSIETLNKWCKATYKRTFNDIFHEKREGGKASLRRRQWNLAETNAAMAIFLGKNYLGQSDDPKKYEKDANTEDKIDKFLDVLTDCLADTAAAPPSVIDDDTEPADDDIPGEADAVEYDDEDDEYNG